MDRYDSLLRARATCSYDSDHEVTGGTAVASEVDSFGTLIKSESCEAEAAGQPWGRADCEVYRSGETVQGRKHDVAKSYAAGVHIQWRCLSEFLLECL